MRAADFLVAKRRLAFGLAGVLTLFGLASAQSPIVVIRNHSIASLNPITPPMVSLFDVSDGHLLGDSIPRNLEFAAYGEDVAITGDGPLVLYQLSDPDQTLLLAKVGGNIILSSFTGRCRQIDSQGLDLIVGNIPILAVERTRALQLFGVAGYPGGIVCEDSAGVIGVTTVPVPFATGEVVSLLFLRDVLDVPTAYVHVSREQVFDFFNATGGLRFDNTVPSTPACRVLDANDNVVGSLAASRSARSETSCEQIGIDYHNCLANDPDWVQFFNGVASEALSPRLSLLGPPCLSAPVDPTLGSAVTCAGLGFLGFGSLIVSGAEGLHRPQHCISELPSGGVNCDAPSGSDPGCGFPGTCNLNGGNGSAFCVYPTTGPNTCTGSQTCGAPPHCEADRCTTTPHWVAGASCGSQSETSCDDPDTCNGLGQCQSNHETIGAPCTPDNACVVGGACAVDGICTGSARDCSDSNLCTDDSCNPVTGCMNVNNTSICRPAVDSCDVAETCSNGSCPVDLLQPNGTACSDGNACSSGDTCTLGSCVSDALIDCNDDNACTLDSCDSVWGCRRQFPGGTAAYPLNTNAWTDGFYNSDLNPRIANDGAGHWVAAWRAVFTVPNGGEARLVTSQSLDNGITWSPPALVDPGGINSGADASLATYGGTWILASDGKVFRSVNNGLTWTPAAAVSGTVVSPRLATNRSGTWVLVWRTQGFSCCPHVEPEVYFSRSPDDGVFWSPAQLLNPSRQSDGRDDLLPALATNGTLWLAAWLSYPVFDNVATAWFSTSSDGGGSWSEAQILIDNSTFTNNGVYDLAWDGANFVGLVFTNRIDLALTRKSPAGSWSAPQLLASPGFYAKLAVAGSTESVVWVSTYPSYSMRIARSADAGVSWTEPIAVQEHLSSSGEPQVASDGGNRWLVAWESSFPNSGGDSEIVFSTFPSCGQQAIDSPLEPRGLSPGK